MSSIGGPLQPLPQQTLSNFVLSKNAVPESSVAWQSFDRPEKAITKERARHFVHRLSYAYMSTGMIGPNNVRNKVILFTENQPLAFVNVLAVIDAGGVVATCPSQASVRDLLYRIDLLQPTAIICSKNTLKRVVSARKEVLHDFAIIVHDTETMTVKRDGDCDLLSTCERSTDAARNEFDRLRMDQPAIIVFSSGTTGSPKAVCISQRNIMSMILQLRHLWSPFLRCESPSTMLATLDNGHVAGLFLNTFCGLGVGLKTVLAPAQDVELVLKAFNSHPVEIFPTVPAVLLRMLESPSFPTTDFSNVKFTCTGAAKAPEDAKRRFSEALPPTVNCQEAWGMTELTFLATMHAPNMPGPFTSIGKPLAGNAIEIRDPSGTKVSEGEEGEIFVSGPTVTPGYYLADIHDHDAKQNGWFRTGDIGSVDKDGYVYITGRNKELIKYNGAQVSPRELEDVILTSPYVNDVAVVGMELKDGNELPTAFVVLHEDAPSDTEGLIRSHVDQQVSSYKRLRGGVHRVKSIPRNPMGKALLGTLKAWTKNLGVNEAQKAKL